MYNCKTSGRPRNAKNLTTWLWCRKESIQLVAVIVAHCLGVIAPTFLVALLEQSTFNRSFKKCSAEFRFPVVWKISTSYCLSLTLRGVCAVLQAVTGHKYKRSYQRVKWLCFWNFKLGLMMTLFMLQHGPWKCRKFCATSKVSSQRIVSKALLVLGHHLENDTY